MIKGAFQRLKALSKKPNPQSRYQFYNIGFHGDEYLIKVVDAITRHADVFIETGTNVGSTIAYVGRKYPHLKCFSCEPDKNAFSYAQEYTKDIPNIRLFNLESGEFLPTILSEIGELNSKQVVFWLDAHGDGFEWPLREEIAYITEHFHNYAIFIDDFKVPGSHGFKFDSYGGQECSLEFIQKSLPPGQIHYIYYPQNYPKTSTHHPLTGWCLIAHAAMPKHVYSQIISIITTAKTIIPE